VLVLLAAACGSEKDAQQTGPFLAILSPAPGASIKGNVVALNVTTGIPIVKADGDATGKTGHYHVFIDRDPVAPGQTIPKEPGIVHSAKNPIEITGLTAGTHRFAVVLGDGNHARIGATAREVSVTLTGPNIDASAPATATAGSALTLEVKVEGVELVKADGDASGRTGHLHVFIDADAPAAGQPIPKGVEGIIHTTDTTIEIAGLAAGEHTLLVVLGDGNHVPFDPPVRDRVVVTVA
jgi:hypothetical protein